MAEEEPVDQKKYFEDLCKPKCVRAWLEYQGCVKRVEADESGHKHCTGQYFDYWRWLTNVSHLSYSRNSSNILSRSISPSSLLSFSFSFLL